MLTATFALTLYGADGAMLTLQVHPGWSHIWNEKHFRISPKQARRVKQFHAEHGAEPLTEYRLHVGAAENMDCPHCAGGATEIIRA